MDEKESILGDDDWLVEPKMKVAHRITGFQEVLNTHIPDFLPYSLILKDFSLEELVSFGQVSRASYRVVDALLQRRPRLAGILEGRQSMSLLSRHGAQFVKICREKKSPLWNGQIINFFCLSETKTLVVRRDGVVSVHELPPGETEFTMRSKRHLPSSYILTDQDSKVLPFLKGEVFFAVNTRRTPMTVLRAYDLNLREVRVAWEDITAKDLATLEFSMVFPLTPETDLATLQPIREERKPDNKIGFLLLWDPVKMVVRARRLPVPCPLTLLFPGKSGWHKSPWVEEDVGLGLANNALAHNRFAMKLFFKKPLSQGFTGRGGFEASLPVFDPDNPEGANREWALILSPTPQHPRPTPSLGFFPGFHILHCSRSAGYLAICQSSLTSARLVRLDYQPGSAVPIVRDYLTPGRNVGAAGLHPIHPMSTRFHISEADPCHLLLLDMTSHRLFILDTERHRSAQVSLHFGREVKKVILVGTRVFFLGNSLHMTDLCLTDVPEWVNELRSKLEVGFLEKLLANF